MVQLTIKSKILLILVFLVGIISFSLLFSQYYFSEKIAIQSTNDTFTLISKQISQSMKKHASDTRNIVKIKSKDKDVLAPITFDVRHPSLHSLIEALELNTNLHAIYIAHANGNYFEVINMHNREKMFKIFDAPKNTYWTVITIIDNVQQNAFLDKEHLSISMKQSHTNYDPHNRPWYQKAMGSKKLIATSPYLFSLIKEMGITYAKAINETGTVLAVDYTMRQLNSILAMHKLDTISEIFMMNSKGEKFLSSEFVTEKSSERSKRLNSDLLSVLEEKRVDEIIQYSNAKGNYLANLITFIEKTHVYLGIEVDADKLFKSHRDNLSYSFMIALLLLMFSVPVILFSANNIARPINVLIEENNKIEERKFADVKMVDSNIIEINALSSSLVSMSKSIQKHAKIQDELLDSLIKLIAEAIDRKSPYTGKHCERVPLIAEMLLDAANASESEAFKAFSFTSEDELRAFEIGAWLHDCGKVTTPAFVVDKSVKLETIYNRIHEIRTRFEVLWRDTQIEYLQKKIDEDTLQKRQTQLLDDFEFIASVNMGSEFMSDEKKSRVKEIAKRQWERHFDDRLGLGYEEYERASREKRLDLPVREDLLSDKNSHIVSRDGFDYAGYEKEGFKLEVPESLYNFGEVYNLCIEKGTLTEEERYKINEHVIVSIKMLEKIPFPETMNSIVEYAGTHHETLIGTGYPRKLSKEDLSVPARIMAIADIFEALTASDRPYKKAKTLSEAIKIMSFMVKDQHIDADLFELFLRSGVYKSYAQKYLETAQIDEVDIEKYLL